MPRKLEEITATYVFEKHRFGSGDSDLIIGEATMTGEDGKHSRITLKVNEEEEEPKLQLTYRFYGFWTDYKNKYTGKTDRQFQAKTFVRCEPHGRAGVIAYLSRAPNIGRVIAGKLYEKFGGSSVRMVREQPDVASAAVARFPVDHATEASAWLDQESLLENCTIEMMDLLGGRGFPKQIMKQAVKEFGNRASMLIRKNPYLLLRFRGCGFARADSLYLDLGKPPERIKRQALCATNTLAQRSSGDTWHFVEVVRCGLSGSIGATDVKSSKAIRLAVRGKIMSQVWTEGLHGVPSWDGDYLWLAEEKKERSETRLARLVVEAMNDNAVWPEVSASIDLSGHQLDTLNTCLASPLAILGGSPGTGKTYVAVQLIRELVELFGADSIGIAAPTGKAAVRLTEALAEYGLPLRAKTWHSLLGVDSVDGGWSFRHGPNSPLPYKVLIGDEMSMCDTDLAASIFAARATGTLCLLIGDINQLPPVGHGAPLRDMIAAGVPYGELREIRRNSGEIVEACANIRDGKQFATGGNLLCERASSPDEQIPAMLRVIARESKERTLDPVWQMQILCAVNKKSDLSRQKLNEVLQRELNPNPAKPGSPFRLADKVVNTKNGWYPEATDWLAETEMETSGDAARNADDKIYVANGELGRVVVVEQKFLIVSLDGPFRAVLVPRGTSSENEGDDSTGTGCNWDLGYALSVHKFQGSEIPVAIVMADDSAGAARVCSREWIYTAISRAKQCCYLIGKEAVVQGFVRRTALDKRKTFLKERIMEGIKDVSQTN